MTHQCLRNHKSIDQPTDADDNDRQFMITEDIRQAVYRRYRHWYEIKWTITDGALVTLIPSWGGIVRWVEGYLPRVHWVTLIPSWGGTAWQVKGYLPRVHWVTLIPSWGGRAQWVGGTYPGCTGWHWYRVEAVEHGESRVTYRGCTGWRWCPVEAV